MRVRLGRHGQLAQHIEHFCGVATGSEDDEEVGWRFAWARPGLVSVEHHYEADEEAIEEDEENGDRDKED